MDTPVGLSITALSDFNNASIEIKQQIKVCSDRNWKDIRQVYCGGSYPIWAGMPPINIIVGIVYCRYYSILDKEKLNEKNI